ncbi:MAG: hypothetical protein IPJ00_04145 [Saprospirales bacterium]|nr:hypothetical protein [Saprospirales bacterium]
MAYFLNLGEKLFGTKKGKPNSAKKIKTIPQDSINWAFTMPLRETIGFNRSDGDRQKKILTRHEIPTQKEYYGTKLYSLKAISLANYLSEFLRK